ncbi:MAG: amidohydrolase family protein, partial [Candidatus Eremiobacteraeota bacterium]|nr:amidohydrolase family protein [Candidatus Eremiobacteraeota bacterium]
MSEGSADLIVLGATMHGVDESNGSAQAFAVRGDRFAYVGSAHDAMALRGPKTILLRAEGCTVLPGLIDAHLHLTNLGLQLARVQLAGARSLEELVARTVAYADSFPDEWILGRGWDQNLWSETAFPCHDALSAAIPHRPVALARVDGHAMLANARAMTVAGVDGSAPDPPGGLVLRDSHGKPTGVFID